jgi:uncharacterized protein
MNDEPLDPVVVPHATLTEDILTSIIEAFVLREGTDYGESELSLHQKVANVLRQLKSGEAQIIFDPNSNTVDVVARAKSWR